MPGTIALALPLSALLLAVLLSASGRRLLEPGRGSGGVVQGRKPCAPGCSDRGNCNYETGRCECPWGWRGEACEVDSMRVCRQTPDDPGSCGLISPKNCECHRQCFRLYCRRGTDVAKCSNQVAYELLESPCFLYGPTELGTAGTRARPQNSSEFPEHPERETVWYQQIPELYGMSEYKDEFILKDPERLYKSPYHRPWISWHQADNEAKSLSSCPTRCSNGRGYCIKWAHMNEPACLCRKGWTGLVCAKRDDEGACWMSPTCGGVGTCTGSGFCKCPDGRWGWGCHRTTAFLPADPQGPLPDARHVAGQMRIYMYDLPWYEAFPHELEEGRYHRDPMYTAYEYFLSFFLSDTTVRTENPYEANLFFVPALNYFYSENVNPAGFHAADVVSYVRQTWPFWNRTGGTDHFMFFTGDRGACDVPRWMQDTIIKVVHFGMSHTGLNWTVIHNHDYACVQVKRDLVVPPLALGPLFPEASRALYEELVASGGRDPVRTKLLTFAGGIGDGEYSGGVRKAVWHHLTNRTAPSPDVVLVEGRTDAYEELFRTSKFCLAPYGHGWGIRLTQAMQRGCVPIIMQDHVYQPYEDFMPYEDFSVRISMAIIPHMVEILRSYTDEQVASMRLAMVKHFQAFIWGREHGGEAYEWTLVGLQRRALHQAARYLKAKREPETTQADAG
ncbi:hypothetical protein HYH03_017086 [Edaphochlamys debaryana]|uniref:EGF-like domain-containing protein n=1 Tax=Edaphochlamys debaryana TaxID=47281 RepID=A0A835XHT9_9CHLO|nr:hypothetical protein HYH03_017086 [Edaphochlamys debaryana]|eukprot:KAG2484066.1 hypothetical protein HYH03_017086 [Edaphochlamys debaryana]